MPNNPTPSQITTALIREQRVIDTESRRIRKLTEAWMVKFNRYMLAGGDLSFSAWKSRMLKRANIGLTQIEREMVKTMTGTSVALNKQDGMEVGNLSVSQNKETAGKQKTTGKSNTLMASVWKGSALSILATEAIRLRTQGLGVPEMSRAIIGTKSQGFKNGLLAPVLNGAESTTNTGIKASTEAIREDRYDSDSGVQGYLWTSILDGKTTQICQGLHAKEFYYYRIVKGKKVSLSGYKPLPPIHYNCRSSTQPIYEGQEPPKVLSFKEWANDPKNDAELLKSMGRTRYNMWKGGKINIERYTDARFKPLTIDELAKAGFVPIVKGINDDLL